jgi:hypothetical protein
MVASKVIDGSVSYGDIALAFVVSLIPLFNVVCFGFTIYTALKECKIWDKKAF